MKNILLLAVLFLSVNITAFAQSLAYELDKIREIKMLESTRDNVERILTGYKSDDDEDDDSNSQTFSFDKIELEVSYTTGDCSDEADETDEWNIAKGKVKTIRISFTDPVKFEDLKYDASDLRKEKVYANVESDFVYYDKEKGIAFFTDEEENEQQIEKIYLFPVYKQGSLLCKNEESELAQGFYSKESFFGNIKLEDRVVISCGHPAVSELNLSANEITASCSATSPEKNKNCSNSPRLINISAKSDMPDDENYLIFEYRVSGGRIVGKGKDVMWDLSDVKPGKYTITVGVDDGCGICGETKTKTVIVK